MIGLAIIVFILGLLAFIGTTIGMVRFPDYLTKSHAASTGDTLSTGLMVFSIILYAISQGGPGAWMLIAKLGLLLLFILIASPTASHVLTQAGYKTGTPHWRKTQEQSEDDHDC